MHLVLRSTKARGEWSLLRRENKELVRLTLAKFANKYGVRILALANVGNHLHLQMKITNRVTYNAFIRAVTGSIAMGVTRRARRSRRDLAEAKTAVKLQKQATDGSRARAGYSETDPGILNNADKLSASRKFWDYRPFSRIATSFREYLNLKDYVRLNQLEGAGYGRAQARDMVGVEKIFEGGG